MLDVAGDVTSDQPNHIHDVAADVVNEPPSHTLASSVVNTNPSQLCNRNIAGDICDTCGTLSVTKLTTSLI